MANPLTQSRNWFEDFSDVLKVYNQTPQQQQTAINTVTNAPKTSLGYQLGSILGELGGQALEKGLFGKEHDPTALQPSAPITYQNANGATTSFDTASQMVRDGTASVIPLPDAQVQKLDSLFGSLPMDTNNFNPIQGGLDNKWEGVNQPLSRSDFFKLFGGR